jgi:hypothetical protein
VLTGDEEEEHGGLSNKKENYDKEANNLIRHAPKGKLYKYSW